MGLLNNNLSIVVSCEHATNRIPRQYLRLFDNNPQILQSHRGHDIGALRLAREIGRNLDAPLFSFPVSRLLIDGNRSLTNRRGLFSTFSRQLTSKDKEEIIERYYLPYHKKLTAEIAENIANGLQVLHLSIHTFTPQLNGQVRNADIGLLYDPRRNNEKMLCAAWQAAVQSSTKLIVRRNYPYKGISDGIATMQRKAFNDHDYIGIELEINQNLSAKSSQIARRLTKTLIPLLEL